MENSTEKLFPFYPLSYSNPCRMNGIDAPFAISGSNPDKKGGGILFWAYDVRERDMAVKAFQNAGYHNVKWEKYNHT
jgi:hypothetical protein